MRIWKLTPTDPSNTIWTKWSPEPIIIHAEREREARHLAVLKTLKYPAGQFEAGGKVPVTCPP